MTLFLLRSLTLCAVATAALALAATAAAHLDVRPRVLESGSETTLLIELPQLRRDLVPTGLDVSANGLEQLSSRLLSRAGLESRWRVRVRVSAPSGPLVVSLRARFDDGPHVITQTLTVVPGREESSSWMMVAVATAALGAAALAGLLLLRRRRSA